jgi:hypothetical protein
VARCVQVGRSAVYRGAHSVDETVGYRCGDVFPIRPGIWTGRA